MSGQNETSPAIMAERAQGGALLEYRLEQVEKMLVEVKQSVHNMRGDLQPVVAMRRQNDDDVKEVKRDIESLRTQQMALDTEFRKWYNRGVGVASVATVIWLVVGGLTLKKLSDVDNVVATVPGIVQSLQRQSKIQNAILKKLGVDPELVPVEP